MQDIGSTDGGDAGNGADPWLDTGQEWDTDACEDAVCTVPCVRYVSDHVALSGDGRCWTSPFKTVQEGIDAAAQEAASNPDCDRVQVWVAAGQYFIFHSGINDTVSLSPRVDVFGGFTCEHTSLDERDWQAYRSILDGRDASWGTNQVLHVVTAAGGIPTLDGFTITKGLARSAENTPSNPNNSGAGLFVGNSSPLISNCTFQRNVAGDESLANSYTADYGAGGGVFNGGPATRIHNCVFIDNRAGYGGAVFNWDNNPEITISLFSENRADYGGAVYNNGIVWHQPVLKGCLFKSNTSSGPGGALMDIGRMSSSITGCEFHDNSAREGGAVWSSTKTRLENGVFAGNAADWHGGALYAVGVLSLGVGNCTFHSNSAGSAGGSIYLDHSPYGPVIIIENSILHGGAPSEMSVDAELAPEVSYSDVEGGSPGAGNIDADPLFVDPAAGDFRLRPGSPCIDAANGDAAPELDHDGNPRYDDPDAPNTGLGPPWADMGAFEYQP
jgi:hypothetical protein